MRFYPIILSIARKIGACVFLTPEDIVEVKPKMLFGFIGRAKFVACVMKAESHLLS